MRKVLMVCSANLCRSPMAERMLQKELSDIGVDDVLVESSGIIAHDGSPAASPAVMELEKHGIDLTNHRTRMITRNMIEESELICVMEPVHMKAISSLAPHASEKVVMMGSFAPSLEGDEIGDPYGGFSGDFSETYNALKEACENIAKQIADKD